MHTEEKKRKPIISKDMAVRVFAATGLLAMLVVIIFGAALMVNYAGRGLTAAVTLLTGQNIGEEVTTTTDVRKVTSGEEFTLSWDHKKKATNGSYSLYYPCEDNVFLIVKTIDEGKKTAVCNKPFEFVNRNNELTLIASNGNDETITLPLYIAFTPNGETKSSINGSVSIEVSNGKIASIDSNDTIVNTESTKTTEVIRYVPIQTMPPQYYYPNPTYNYSGQNYNYVNTVTPQVENPNGQPDFRVSLIEIGVLNSSNQFSRTDMPRRSDYKVAIRFRIENIGNKTSLPYRFNAYLPTFPTQTYNSDEKPGIAPGASVDYTIGFDRALEGNVNARILVDGGNYISESNENNNELNVPFRIY